jgi:hypothetical protein
MLRMLLLQRVRLPSHLSFLLLEQPFPVNQKSLSSCNFNLSVLHAPTPCRTRRLQERREPMLSDDTMETDEVA